MINFNEYILTFTMWIGGRTHHTSVTMSLCTECGAIIPPRYEAKHRLFHELLRR